ncbi:acyltransferase [Clostridia bacterium]|nr:acyltransferase [Clostridia bacterium]
MLTFHANLFFKIVTWNTPLDFPYALVNRAFNGNFAVCVFFILSGYVLSLPYVRNKTVDFGELTFRRWFRLTPLALVSVVLAYVLWITIGFPVRDMMQFGPGFAWAETLYNFEPHWYKAILNPLFEIYNTEVNNWNGVLWSLKWELYASLILFVCLGLFKSKRNFLLVGAIISIWLVLSDVVTGSYLALFFVGAALNILHSKNMLNKWFLWLLLIPAIYLGSVSEWYSDGQFLLQLFNISNVQQMYVPIHAVAAAMMLVAVLSNGYVQKFLSLRIFRWLGKISFCLYVVHIIVILCFGNHILLALANVTGVRFTALVALLAIYAISFVLAALMYRFVDVPAQKLAKYISRRLLSWR